MTTYGHDDRWFLGMVRSASPDERFQEFRPITLYRYFDADDRLLYVGIAVDVDARDRQHTRSSWWHERATKLTTEVINEWGCHHVEAAAILAERPLANKCHNLKTARRRHG